MKIAIFGSGGLGAYYGIRLAQAGHSVSFIARGEHLNAMRNNGLKLQSTLGDVHLKNIAASNDPAFFGEQDLVLVSVKTWQLEQAAETMKPLLAEHTVVLPFLNGVDAPDVLGRILGRKHVLGGLSRIFSKIEAPGVIGHFNDSAFVEFGELDEQSITPRCENLLTTFQEAGVEAVASTNVRQSLWRKLILVSAWGGLGALTGCTMGELRKHLETRELITACADESRQVAECEGQIFSHDLSDELWGFYDGLPETASTSLSRDIQAGRPSELEAWHGVIVRLAEKHGIAAPNQRFVYHALLPLERKL